MQYSVKIDDFEGPLDLLLHLINRLEIDIYNIPVSKITDQYLDYIHTMQDLQLDIASEYLVMAATLLAIKSKMLLPKHEEELYDEDMAFEQEEDPREELMRRLIEYKKYKGAAEVLKEREAERSNVFTRSQADLSKYVTESEMQAPPIKDASIYDMIGALQRMFLKKALQKPKKTTINRMEIPIEQRMEEIVQILKSNRGNIPFEALFPNPIREHIVVTFLAILELMKQNSITCIQSSNFSAISVSLKGDVHVDLK
jgi:segregation and condensation protein A